jgi:hypothetical protein
MSNILWLVGLTAKDGQLDKLYMDIYFSLGLKMSNIEIWIRILIANVLKFKDNFGDPTFLNILKMFHLPTAHTILTVNNNKISMALIN